MSINNFSTSLNERSASPSVPVAKPMELINKPDFKPENQSIINLVHKFESISADKSKDLASDADKDIQATPQGEKNAEVEDLAKQGQSLTQSLQQISQNTNQLSPLQVRKLEFSTVEESGRTVVKVIDKDSDDVIRQIPSEEFIRVAERIGDLSNQMNAVQGVLFDSKV